MEREQKDTRVARETRYCKSCACKHGEDDGGALATFIGEKEKLQKRRVGTYEGWGLVALRSLESAQPSSPMDFGPRSQ